MRWTLRSNAVTQDRRRTTRPSSSSFTPRQWNQPPPATPIAVMPKTILRCMRVEATARNRVGQIEMKNALKTSAGLGMLAIVLALALTGQQNKKYVPPDYEKKMQAIK